MKKNKMPFLTVVLALIIAIGLGSCNDGKDDPVAEHGLRFKTAGNLSFSFNHQFSGQALQRNVPYVTPANDTISINQLRYYFSNVQLLNASGSWVNMGNYHLIDIEDPSSLNAAISNIPSGVYSKIRFFVGVDSTSNHSGTQDGVLSPSNDMFWTWNTGYIFFRLKGRYSTSGTFSFDVGGDKNLPVVELDLTSLKKEGSSMKLNMLFNVAEVFMSPHVYDLKTMPADIHTSGNAGAPLIRDNIQMGAFTIVSVE